MKNTTDETRIIPTLEELRARRDQILALTERYGAYDVRVFGSVARGDATPDSDIDLLVNYAEGTSLYEVSGLRLDLQELLGREVDVVADHANMREPFRQQVMKDAVPL